MKNKNKPLTAIPDKMFALIKKSNVVKYLKTCKEINIAFIPYEEQVIFFLFYCLRGFVRVDLTSVLGIHGVFV